MVMAKERRPNPKGAGRKPVADGETFSHRLGKNIQARRTALGLSLDALAEKTGGNLSGSQISGYERGVEPGITKLIWLAHALGVQPYDLFPADARKAIKRAGTSAETVARVIGARRP